MDAFFASVEQQSNPKLRGKPIAVIGSGGRTVITTRSYEARKYGVKTGMNLYEAKKLCPPLIFMIGTLSPKKNNLKLIASFSPKSCLVSKHNPSIPILLAKDFIFLSLSADSILRMIVRV